MSDSSHEQPPVSRDSSRAAADVPDPMLQMFAGAANEQTGARIPIRLFIGSGVLSGYLVGGQTYYQALSALVGGESSEEPDVEEYGMAGVFSWWARWYERESGNDRPVAYVHLADAWLHTPNERPAQVGYWRGRLSRVDGWALGSYAAPQE